MKKILTLLFILFLLKAGAQTSVTAVFCNGHTFYVRVSFTQKFVPAHTVSNTSCPDNSVHPDTEEGTYVECLMELFANPACSQPVNVDPRFFTFERDHPGSTGTTTNPFFLYRSICPAPFPAGSVYRDNYRIDQSAIHLQQCNWDCAAAGYNCYPTNFGVPVNYNIVINCCYTPATLAVHLVSFDGVRNAAVNTLSWVLENKQDFVKLELERSFDGVHYAVVYTTADVNISSYADRTDSTAYYRLKIYNTNNTFFYSSSVVLKAVAEAGKVVVSPSPFGKALHVSVPAGGRFQTVFKLLAFDGRVVFSSVRLLRRGINSFVFDLPVIPAGVYALVMTNEQGIIARKVLKL